MGCYRGPVSGSRLDSKKVVRVRQVVGCCSVCGVHVPPCYSVNRSISTFFFLSSVQSSWVLYLSIPEPTALIAKYYFHTSSLLISAEPSHRCGSWQNPHTALLLVYLFKDQWLLHAPPRLTVNNSTSTNSLKHCDSFLSGYFGFPCQCVFSYMLFLPKDKRSQHGNLPKSSGLSEIGERWIQKHFTLILWRVQRNCLWLTVSWLQAVTHPRLLLWVIFFCCTIIMI